MKTEEKEINEVLEYIKSKHNGEIPYKYGANECARLMAAYHKQQMEEMMPKSKKLSNRKELSLWNYWDATTSEDRVDIVERAFKMIEAQKKYIELLSEELDELAVLAHSRGWRSKRAEQGEQMNYFTGNLSGWVIPNT